MYALRYRSFDGSSPFPNSPEPRIVACGRAAHQTRLFPFIITGESRILCVRMTTLILKRSIANTPAFDAENDYVVLDGDHVIGRIFLSP